MWRRWLIVAAGITALTGLTFAVLATLGATAALDALFDLVYLPGEIVPAGDVAGFALGVAGAVMAGWAVTLLVLLAGSDGPPSPTVWRAMTYGLVVWFVVDTVLSVSVGATANVVLNLVFAALFTPPLVATRPSA